MWRAVVAIACVAACARPPAATCPPAAAPAAGDAASSIPPEDDQLRTWKAIAATPDKTPQGGATAQHVIELVEYLGSPDPVRRDGIAYEVLAKWIGAKVLDDTKVRGVMEQLVAYMSGPLDKGGVFRRSFAALVLAEVARRDRKTPFLTVDERRALVKAVREYAERETDLRGHTGATGWAHAAAHSADLMVWLAQLEGLTDADRAGLLDAVASFVARRHGAILAYGEDTRLANAVAAIARAGVTAEAIDAWLGKLVEPLGERMTPQFDANLFAAQRNVRNLLYTLHVHGSTTKPTTPGELVLFDKVRAVIAE
ncbi:MAG: DUF2785 domain-containing protein [Deltaproteobacteria bacterium]|nr:DUF2785 domain-containing protein [Deltaproteobacteria bacterium]